MFLIDIVKKALNQNQEGKLFCSSCLAIIQSGEVEQHRKQNHYIYTSQETSSQQHLKINISLSNKEAFQIINTFKFKNDFFPNLISLDLKVNGSKYTWQEYVPNPIQEFYLWGKLRGLKRLKFTMAEVRLDSALLRLFFKDFQSISSTLDVLILDLFNNQEIQHDILIEMLAMLKNFNQLQKFHLNLRRIQTFTMNDQSVLEAFTSMLESMKLLEDLDLNLAQIPDFNEENAFNAIIQSCCQKPKKLQRFAISLQFSGLFNNHLKTISEQIMNFQDCLEILSLNFSYNNLGEGCIVPLYQSLNSFQRIKSIDLNFQGTSETLSPKDLFFINKMGFNVLEKNRMAKISLKVPISYQRQFSKYEKQFQIMSQLGWIVWKSLLTSPMSHLFRMEVSLEVFLDYLF